MNLHRTDHRKEARQRDASPVDSGISLNAPEAVLRSGITYCYKTGLKHNLLVLEAGFSVHCYSLTAGLKP